MHALSWPSRVPAEQMMLQTMHAWSMADWQRPVGTSLAVHRPEHLKALLHSWQ